MMLLRAWMRLVWLSFRRLLWSMQTLMVLLPLVGFALVIWWLRIDQSTNLIEAFERFSQRVVFITFSSVVVPLCVLAFGTACISGEREDRTLMFVLVRPIPRGLVLAAKWVAALPLGVGVVAGSFAVLCRLAGDTGHTAYDTYLPALLAQTVAYHGLFLLFAVTFRYATVVALVYSVFFESIIGNLPGIIKCITVNYYARSWMHISAVPEGLRWPDPKWFEPISLATAQYSLAAWLAVPLLLAAVVFSRREYRDLG